MNIMNIICNKALWTAFMLIGQAIGITAKAPIKEATLIINDYSHAGNLSEWSSLVSATQT